jgi:hypothetical protein
VRRFLSLVGRAALAARLAAAPPAAAAAQGFCSGRPSNLPLDLDLDGAPDTVCVSDYDRDGALEMDDLQDAIDALADPGPKSVYVLPGSYAPPAQPGLRPGRRDALIELPSHSSLVCETPGTRLRGPAGHDASQNFAVVGNADHTLGNDDVHVRGCEIDGGAPDRYDGTGVVLGLRMGVYLRRTRNSSVENAYVHHTYHTGLYTSNSNGDRFVGNRVEDAGGYGNITSFSPTYPCIYVYSLAGGTVDGFVASGNALTRCASSGLNTRNAATGPAGRGIRNTLWEDNTVENTGHAVGQGGSPGATGSTCITLRGVDGITLRHNRCISSGGLYIFPAAGYASDGDINAVKNALVEDLVLYSVDAVAGIFVGSHAENLSLRGVQVLATRSDGGEFIALDCLQLGSPLRGAVFEDMLLRNCGASGIYELTEQGSGHAPGEALTLRRVTIANVDMVNPTDALTRSALHLRGPHRGLVLEDFTAKFASRSEIDFERRLEDARLERVEVDARNPGWLGAFPEAAVPACAPARAYRWIINTNGSHPTDCNFAPGTTGSHAVRCRCSGSAWGWYTPAEERPGIVFGDADAPSARVVLRDVAVRNARDLPGIRMTAEVEQVSVVNLLGADDSAATDLAQNSAIEVLDAAVDIEWSNVRCVGTDPAHPCIEVLRDATDWDGDGVLNAGDNCISTPNPDQIDVDGDGAGRACDSDDDGDLLADVYENDTGVFVSPTATGSDPLDPDSDDDGALDGIEVMADSDPNDASERPPAVPALGPAAQVLAALSLLAAAAGCLRR